MEIPKKQQKIILSVIAGVLIILIFATLLGMMGKTEGKKYFVSVTSLCTGDAVSIIIQNDYAVPLDSREGGIDITRRNCIGGDCLPSGTQPSFVFNPAVAQPHGSLKAYETSQFCGSGNTCSYFVVIGNLSLPTVVKC